MKDHAANEETRDDKEHVDADIAAGHEAIQMKPDHRENRKCSQSIDVRAIRHIGSAGELKRRRMPDLQGFPTFVLIFGKSVKLTAPVRPHRVLPQIGGEFLRAASSSPSYIPGYPNGLGATVCMR